MVYVTLATTIIFYQSRQAYWQTGLQNVQVVYPEGYNRWRIRAKGLKIHDMHRLILEGESINIPTALLFTDAVIILSLL